MTLAETLQAAGSATGAMSKWGLGPPGSSGDPNKQGFDLFFGSNCQSHAHNFYPTYLWRAGSSNQITVDVAAELRQADSGRSRELQLVLDPELTVLRSGLAHASGYDRLAQNSA